MKARRMRFGVLAAAPGPGLDGETNGGMAMVAVRPKNPPDCQPSGGWYPAVMLPAFASIETVILFPGRASAGGAASP